MNDQFAGFAPGLLLRAAQVADCITRGAVRRTKYAMRAVSRAKARRNTGGPPSALSMGMTTSDADVEPLTNRIIASAIEVHKTLGPGLLESVYQECMVVELQSANLDVKSDWHVPIEYKGRRIRSKLRIDLRPQRSRR